MEHGTDQEIIAVMIGTDEWSNRLRQSPPYVGLFGPVALERLTKPSSCSAGNSRVH
jgi:hypothetical protein